ncbi:MAG TPA: hypothetical protein VH440_01265 [Candidatus Limnocylindrales bacterium]|jgi:hypothetical protein
MDRPRRWDTDERGIGVADARGWRALIEGLARVADADGWVAEEPEAHLLPHLVDATAAGPLAIRGTRTEADGTFAVDLGWVGDGPIDRRALRSALFAMIAPIAETISVVHEPPDSEGRLLEVLTGSGGAGPGTFGAHGHTLRLSVAVPDPSPSRE